MFRRTRFGGLFFSLGTLGLLACGLAGRNGGGNDSRLFWHTGAGGLRGHEDITRFAVDIANQQLNAHPELYFDPVAYGDQGAVSTHPMIRGNFETDFPSTQMRQIYGATSSTDWHKDGALQHLHSLRDRHEIQPVTNSEACANTRVAIANAVQRAESSRKLGDHYWYLFWLGHAVHILQDSYSPAHVIRTGMEGSVIADFCTYAVKAPGVCYHQEVDPRDRVWRTDSLRCTFDSHQRDWGCLTTEAQYASYASADLLAELAQSQLSGEPTEQVLSRVMARRLNCPST